jgi:V/A-type H+/Na+-transporting ATPase subunit G/H
MKAEILSEIKAAEAEAQRMIDEAQTQKEATIEDAKKRSFEIIDAAEKEASTIADDLNATADSEITRAKQEIHKAGEADILKVNERAEKKHAEALSYLAEEFKRTHYV